MEKEGDVAAKRDFSSYCAVVNVSGDSRWERGGVVSSQTESERS